MSLALHMWAGALFAQHPEPVTVVITGREIDATTRDPIRGATVEVEGADLRVKTDRAGSFELNPIGFGQYRLLLSLTRVTTSWKMISPFCATEAWWLRCTPARDRERITGIVGVVTNRDNGSRVPGAAVGWKRVGEPC